MLKLYKPSKKLVVKGGIASLTSSLATMIPMHVNAADHISNAQFGLYLYGGAALAAIVGVAICAIRSRDDNFDPDCREAVELDVKFNRSAIKDETTDAKQYFKIVNKK